MIAALYVETGGVYYGLPDVDPWDEERDARLYAGPWPVVAHPPCKSWSIMGQCRPEVVAAGDGGTFAAALASVREFGGILEHPAFTLAWAAHHLPRPTFQGWTRTMLDEGWVCEVDQFWYGHRCNKRTWLYFVGPAPPPMMWDTPPRSRFRVRSDGGGGRDQRSKTPEAFRDVLLAMARSAGEQRKETGA